MSKFDDFYSKKTVVDLLEKLITSRVSPETIDQEWYDALILHLKERHLSNEEIIMMEKILSADPVSLKRDKEMAQSLREEQVKKGTTSLNINEDGEKYAALKTLIGLISILGYIVIVVGIGSLIFLASNDQVFIGVIAFVISIVISLPLFAISNLIYVFIDIERNTRKTMEAIKKLNK